MKKIMFEKSNHSKSMIEIPKMMKSMESLIYNNLGKILKDF